MNAIIEPQVIRGRVAAPSSKSHTIRAFAAALLADGTSYISNVLRAEDTERSIAACAALGGVVERWNDGYRVEGVGSALHRRAGGGVASIDAGNSGTTLRIFAAIAALFQTEVRFDGDAQLRMRPMGALLRSLAELGATVRPLPQDSVRADAAAANAPFAIRGPLTGGETRIACPTSQYLSGLLFAVPYAATNTTIHVLHLEERPYIALTLEWLQRCGIRYDCDGELCYRVPGRQRYTPFNYRVEGDYSSATFMICAAVLTGQGVEIDNLSSDSRQGDRRVVDVLRAMGANIIVHDTFLRIPAQNRRQRTATEGEGAGANRHVLRGGRFDLNDMPDALPALMAVACYATEAVIFCNVAHARIKETDRIATMSTELRKMGANIREQHDGVTIYPSALSGARLSSHGDHRVAMALAVAALAARGRSAIYGAEAVNITYPDFFRDMSHLAQKKCRMFA